MGNLVAAIRHYQHCHVAYNLVEVPCYMDTVKINYYGMNLTYWPSNTVSDYDMLPTVDI